MNFNIYQQINKFIILLSLFTFSLLESTFGSTFLSGKEIFSISDGDSVVWVSFGDGIARINKNSGKVIVFDSSNTIYLKSHVYCVALENNVLWIGTQGGLIKYDGNEWVKSTPNPFSNIPEIYAIQPNRDGGLWVGTTGLCSFDGNQWSNYHTSIIADDWSYSIAVDSQGSVYSGASCGVIKFSNNSWSIIDTSGFCDQDTLYNGISSMALDRQNNVWEACTRGLRCISNTSFQEFRPDNSDINSSNIRTILIDSNNNVLAGSADSGIIKYNGSKWINQKEYNSGLPSLCVTKMVFDKSGNIWVGTSSGLVFINTNSNNVLLKGRVKHPTTSIAINNRKISCTVPSKGTIYLILRDIKGRILWRSNRIYQSEIRTLPYSISTGIYLLEINTDGIAVPKILAITK